MVSSTCVTGGGCDLSSRCCMHLLSGLSLSSDTATPTSPHATVLACSQQSASSPESHELPPPLDASSCGGRLVAGPPRTPFRRRRHNNQNPSSSSSSSRIEDERRVRSSFVQRRLCLPSYLQPYPCSIWKLSQTQIRGRTIPQSLVDHLGRCATPTSVVVDGRCCVSTLQGCSITLRT